MKALTTGWTPRERALLALCLVSLGISMAGYLNLGGSATAGPNFGGVGTIDTSEIRNGTIRSSDLRNNSIKARDLGLYERTGASSYVAPGATRRAHVICDPGDQVISAGYNGSDTQVLVMTDFLAEPLAVRESLWRFDATNPGQVQGFFETRGLCLKG